MPGITVCGRGRERLRLTLRVCGLAVGLALLAGSGAVQADEATTPQVTEVLEAQVLGATDTSAEVQTESVVTLMRYQQTDSRLTYLGAWSVAVTWSASGGSYHSTSSSGAAVLVNFDGTSVALIGKTCSWYGKALVSLDGGLKEEVDFYSPITLWKQRVYERVGLEPGAHTLTIEWAGAKNDLSGGLGIGLDALDVAGTAEAVGTLTQAPVPVRNQENDPHFKFVGGWSKSWTWSASGGSFAYADSPGSAMSVAFEGTHLTWYAKAGQGYGKARLVLDGGAPVTVDLYSSYDRYKRPVYATGLLEDGPHVLSIYWIGRMNPVARGTRIDVDTFDIMGVTSEAAEPPPIEWRYQQTDSRLTYLGAWSVAVTWSASGGSYHSTSSSGAAVLVNFDGTSVALIGKTCPWYGKALVSLDGGLKEEVDFYSPITLWKQRVYERVGLEPGAHTMFIERADFKNDLSIGYGMGLDGLDITGALTQAPGSTTYQQSDGHLIYEGRWFDTVASGASGGSFWHTDSASGIVRLRFEGAYLSWVAKTGPQYGRAYVSLDGGPEEEVDLYSASPVYGRCVYSTGGLEPGVHNFAIRCSGTKNPASTGYLVDIDALRLVGTLSRVESDGLRADSVPFALVRGDKTRVTFMLGAPPQAVDAAVTGQGDLTVSCTGLEGVYPSMPLGVGSTELRSVATSAGTEPGEVYLAFDTGRYKRFRVMSLAASQVCLDRIVVDVYRRTDGPYSDGPPLICLDPGHGGSDNHAVGVISRVPEKSINLAVGQLVAADLANSGLRVLLTRDSDVTVTLQRRCDLANGAGASAFVSIHSNGFDDPTVGGTETFYAQKTASYTAAAQALAGAVQSRLVAALGFKDRGARTYYGGSLMVLSGTYMPAALVELGFITNAAEDAVLSTASGQQAAAAAIADAIREYLGWSTQVYESTG